MGRESWRYCSGAGDGVKGDCRQKKKNEAGSSNLAHESRKLGGKPWPLSLPGKLSLLNEFLETQSQVSVGEMTGDR